MSFPKFKELNDLNLFEVEKEIAILQKNLFDFRFKKTTSQSIKPHLFKHTKHRLKQLMFKKSVLSKTEK
jgi:large subunit ribosomal protein L29